jgi:hypothetical protein
VFALWGFRVENGSSGWVGYAVQTAVDGGSELLIFVGQKLSDRPPSCRHSPSWRYL